MHHSIAISAMKSMRSWGTSIAPSFIPDQYDTGPNTSPRTAGTHGKLVDFKKPRETFKHIAKLAHNARMKGGATYRGKGG
mmetsp:Transcript_8779/g.39011  ORF Transcript_8779/g.39011 Transcript_8779/m.39011 type:complete len:80 (-) Transcript_8779:899-1138(-)